MRILKVAILLISCLNGLVAGDLQAVVPVSYNIKHTSTENDLSYTPDFGLSENLSNSNNPFYYTNNFTLNELTYKVKTTSKDILFSNNDIVIKNLYTTTLKEKGYIEYEIKNKNIQAIILVHNVLGSVIAQYTLTPEEQNLIINAEDLNPGIYFYTLDINQKNIVTKKFVVKR